MKRSKAYNVTRQYFKRRLGFREPAFLAVIAEYAEHLHVDTGGTVCELIQLNWDAFMKWWGTVKKKYKKEYFKLKTRRKYNWNDYQSEQSFFNEALQYTNGSADDF